MNSDYPSLNIEQILGILRRRVPWILLCAVIVAAVAFGFSRQQTKKYVATATVDFNTNPLSQQIAGLPSSSNSSSTAQQASDLELVRRGDTAAKTAAVLGRGLTEREVGDSLSIAAQGESSVVAVSSTSQSPRLAAGIANTYVRLFVQEQEAANRRYFKSALAIVHRQLAALPPAQRVGSDGLLLQNRAQSLALLAELNYDNVQVTGEALTPTSPSSPKVRRNTILGGVLGLLLGLCLAFALERFDRRIRRPDGLETVYGLPLLGTIPESTALARSAGNRGKTLTVLPQAEAEAFSLIWAHLRFLNINRELHTLVIASAEAGDGKTTVARHLAEAAARLGSRVLLLEADLRHPTLARYLGIDHGPGLADVLIGDVAIGNAIQSVELEAARGEGAAGRTLSVLTAGAVLPPNPGELLEGRAIHTALEWAKWSRYDLVVVDTPPLSAVSDGFTLLSDADGVVLVGRVGHSRRDAAARLRQVLASSTATLLGVIANSSRSGVPEPYPSDAELSRAGGAPSGTSATGDLLSARQP
jgi:capsular exopolysaccharide synthesis family protein